MKANREHSIIKVNHQDIVLRQLIVDDIGDDYVSWLNDPVTIKYLEIRHKTPISRDNVSEFVSNCLTNHRPHWGIFVNNNHVGNISCAQVNNRYKWFDISNIIGDKAFTGSNLAKFSLAGALTFMFDYGYNKATAGTYSVNMSGITLLTNLGFKRCCTSRSSVIYNNKFIDTMQYDLMKKDWDERSIKPPKIKVIPPPWMAGKNL